MPTFAKRNCQNCDNRIEYDLSLLNPNEILLTACPHCGKQTKLNGPKSINRWFIVSIFLACSTMVFGVASFKNSPISKSILKPFTSQSQNIPAWAIANTNARIVAGELSDSSDYSKWGSPIDLSGTLPKVANSGHLLKYKIVADRILKDKIVCSFVAVTYWFETYSGQAQDESEEVLKNIVVYNYPNPENLVSGQIICGSDRGVEKTFKVIRVANYNMNGLSLEAYDCGMPIK